MTRIVVPAARCAALLLLASSALGCLASQADPSERQAGNSVSTLRAGSPASVPPAEGRTFTSPAPDDARMLAFAKAIGVECNDDSGRFECVGGRPEVGDYFDVTLNVECKLTDFSLHTLRRADLRDRITPLDTRTVATATPTDMLCAQAVGSIKGEAEYYYVVLQAPDANCVTTGLLRSGRKGCHAGWLDVTSVHP